MSPFDEVLDQLLNRCRKSAAHHAKKQVQKLSQLPQEALQRLVSQFRQNRVSQQIEACYNTVYHMCQAALRGPHVAIEVDVKQLDYPSVQQRSTLIKGKLKFTPPGRFFSQEVDCFLSCGHWAKLGPVKDRTINLIDHLDKLFPSLKQGINDPPSGSSPIRMAS